MGANLEKSLFAPRAYAVPLCPKGEIVFVCTLRPLWSCYAPRAFVVFVCSATSKSLYTSCATLYSLYMVCTPMQSLYNQKRKSLCLSFATFAVPLITSRTYAVYVCSSTSKVSTISHNPMQSLYSRKALQSSCEQKRKSLCLLFCACSLHTLRPP